MDPTSFSIPGARPAPPAGLPGVIDVTEATFAAEVVDRSRTTPVVLDLWAAWCAPCRQLSPILEKLAGEANGAWVLAKVDVDANPRIAEALGVQGIPAVKAVVDGQLAGEFTGALPEPQVRAWLAEIGITGSGTAPADPAQPDPRFAAALRAEQAGDLDAAAAGYRAVLEAEPGHAGARAGSARIAVLHRAVRVDPVACAARVEADPNDAAAAADLADLEFAHGRVEAAFERLLGVVRRTAGEPRDLARARLVELFEALPADDPRVIRARRDLASALF